MTVEKVALRERHILQMEEEKRRMEGLQGDLSWSSAAVIARKWLLANSLFSFFAAAAAAAAAEESKVVYIGRRACIAISWRPGDPKVDIKEQMDVEDLTNDQLRSHLQTHRFSVPIAKTAAGLSIHQSGANRDITTRKNEEEEDEDLH